MTVADPNRRPRVVVLAAEDQPLPYNLKQLRGRADVVLTGASGLPAALPGADVLFLWDFFSAALRGAWPHADTLRWVHVAAAGVDAIMFDALRGSDVVVTNARGVFDGPIAEFVLACILAHDKRLHEGKSLQRRGLWRHREPARTAGSRALIVGTGGIGRATARLLRAVGLQVRGAGRTPREHDDDFGTVVPSAGLAGHAGWADHLVLAAPLTAQTHHLVDQRVLAAMKPGAHLVNVGRGALVEEPALVAALRSGRIAASLDVFEQEPLPAGHPFWDLENVHVSAHLSGDVVGWRDALADQFLANLERWTAGQPLADTVDKTLGYVPSARPGTGR